MPDPVPASRATGAERLRALLAEGPVVMGILNVTPDSFSDGGRHLRREDALAQARAMLAAGAKIIDVGGESTRPGAVPVGEDEELSRVLPVIEALRGESDVLISIDSMKPAVMAAACAAGAGLINDVSGLRAPGAIEVAVAQRAAVCIGHMRGTPRSMQAAPDYDDVVVEVAEYLAGRVAACVAAGVTESAILVDPGIGFGKRLAHNLALLANMRAYTRFGAGALIGVSRKSMFGELHGASVDARLPGALAVAALAVWQGARVIRAHDVAETVQAVATAAAMVQHRS